MAARKHYFCDLNSSATSRSKSENSFLFGVCFLPHTLRPKKGNIKWKEELPGEIFSADLSLRGEINYLDYFKLSKEKLHKEASTRDQTQ